MLEISRSDSAATKEFGRTVHSLISANPLRASRFVLISPEELRIGYIREDVRFQANNIPFTEVERLEDAMPIWMFYT